MEIITSVNNALVKDTLKYQQKKYRDSDGKFLLEGKKCITEAVQNGIEIDYIFVRTEKTNEYYFFKGRIIQTNDVVLKKISTTDSAPEAVGVANRKMYSKNDFKNLDKVILLENIQDLGNLGTIIRTAAALNVKGIVLYGKCADVYNPKCVRSTVGNLWKIPIINLHSVNEINELFKDYQKVATLPLSKNYLKDFKPKNKALIMFGSEADGLSNELINISTEDLKIEMNEEVESLNLAISCAIVMYKIM